MWRGIRYPPIWVNVTVALHLESPAVSQSPENDIVERCFERGESRKEERTELNLSALAVGDVSDRDVFDASSPLPATRSVNEPDACLVIPHPTAWATNGTYRSSAAGSVSSGIREQRDLNPLQG